MYKPILAIVVTGCAATLLRHKISKLNKKDIESLSVNCVYPFVVWEDLHYHEMIKENPKQKT